MAEVTLPATGLTIDAPENFHYHSDVVRNTVVHVHKLCQQYGQESGYSKLRVLWESRLLGTFVNYVGYLSVMQQHVQDLTNLEKVAISLLRVYNKLSNHLGTGIRPLGNLYITQNRDSQNGSFPSMKTIRDSVMPLGELLDQGKRVDLFSYVVDFLLPSDIAYCQGYLETVAMISVEQQNALIDPLSEIGIKVSSFSGLTPDALCCLGGLYAMNQNVLINNNAMGIPCLMIEEEQLEELGRWIQRYNIDLSPLIVGYYKELCR